MILRPSVLCITAALISCAQTPTGIFDSHEDVGETPKKGAVEADAAGSEYRVTGGGANIWAATDAFHFVWKRWTGDLNFTAEARFLGAGAVDHRKAVLMIRQGMEPNAAYADIALHGDGMASLQYRSAAGAPTLEMRSPILGASRLRLERRGRRITAAVGGGSAILGPVELEFKDPVYVGIGVCSHDANVLETAVFSKVKLEIPPPPPPPGKPYYRSRVSVYDLNDNSVRVVYQSEDLFEAPNWAPDGTWLLANSGGELYRIGVDGSTPVLQKLLACSGLKCNNDHGFSPDGRLLAISASSPASRGSNVYVVALDGTERRQVSAMAPSYWHSWSPDGKWLAMVADRTGNFDLFRIPAGGGEEQRLTSHPGYDEGPDYDAKGKWIYFNSDRSGSWDIWRMPAEGAGANDGKAERVTGDEGEDWFPHPSPDGKWLVYLTFPKGTKTHDDKMDVELRMIPMPGVKAMPVQPRTLTKIYGGQGTINVNSWSPDSMLFAFVQYELVQPPPATQ